MRFVRSSESLAFETVWSRLPRKGRLPSRGAFEPRLAKALLRNLLLVQAPSTVDPTLHIRLVGEAIRAQILNDIVGVDFLDFLPEPQQRAVILDVVRDMFSRPCGAWWIAPVHYKRGYSQLWELTAFPLAANERGQAAVVVHVLPFHDVGNTHGIVRKLMIMDYPTQLERIAIDPGV